MCMFCGVTQVPVCGAFGPCGPFLQQMAATALVVGGAGLGMLRLFAKRLYGKMTSFLHTFAYARYESGKSLKK